MHRALQGGFTIIELMVAMTLGLMLMSILGAIYFNSIQTVDALTHKIGMNRQAREMFDILSMGGARSGINIYSAGGQSLDNHNYIFGIRGRRLSGTATSPDGWGLPSGIITRDVSKTEPILYRLGLSSDDAAPAVGTNSPILSSEIGAVASSSEGVPVSCTDDYDPVWECASGQTVTLRGYLRSDVNPSVDGISDIANTRKLTRRFAIMVVDPYMYNLSKNQNRLGIMDDQIYDVYWSAFLPKVEYHP